MAAEIPFYELDNREFKGFLRRKLKGRFGVFNGLLYKYGALIAGGSLTNTFLGTRVHDLDIYVNYEQAEDFIEELISIVGLKIFNQIPCSSYDKAFLTKNNILLLSRGAIVKDDEPVIQVDLMICKTPPINVVTNFDLTACQIWYNGDTVKTTHREILTKVSYLNESYAEELAKGNSYILKRIQKYIRRGLTIKFPAFDIKDSREDRIAREQYNVEALFVSILYESLINYPFRFYIPHIRQNPDNMLPNSDYMIKAHKFIMREYTFDEFLRVTGLPRDNGFSLVRLAENIITKDGEIDFKGSEEQIEALENRYYDDDKTPELHFVVK